MEIKENLLVLWHYIESVFSFDPNSPLLFTQFQFWAFFAIVFAVFALFRNKRLLRNTYLFSSAFCSTTRRADCFSACSCS